MLSTEPSARLGLPAGTTWAAFVLAVTVVSAVVVGGLAIWVAPTAAVVAALVLVYRNDVNALVGLAMWLWLLAPLVRRVVDWLTIYHDASPVLLAAPLVSLMALLSARSRREIVVLAAVAAAYLAALAGIGYGAMVGLVTVGLVPVAGASLELLAPLALGAAVLLSPDRDGLRETVERLARWGLLLVGGYTVAQFFLLPAWDEAWISDSGISSTGTAEALVVRAFGTLNSAGPLAYTMSSLILLILCARGRRPAFDSVALVVGYLALALSLVRGAWLAHVVALVFLLAVRRIRLGPVVAVAAGILAVGAIFGGAIVDQVTARVDASIEAGTADTSLNARFDLQTDLLASIVEDPWGTGLGSTGLATQLDDTGGGGIQNVDSGVFETLLTTGLLVGGAVILALGVAVLVALGRGRANELLAGPAAVSLGLFVGLVFTDTRKGVYGSLLWVSLGLVGYVREVREKAGAPRSEEPLKAGHHQSLGEPQ